MIRDRKYLDSLRHERCIVTGRRGTDQESVVPAHIGTAGKGLKAPDNEALPLHHAIHNAMHQSGEMTVLREHLPDDVLREALRALARERYAKWRTNLQQ